MGKIRGELYKMKGGGHSAFFQDCVVSKWDPEECSKECDEGEQKLSRSVLTHPDGGAKCLPLAALRSCNNHPCPVDCRHATIKHVRKIANFLVGQNGLSAPRTVMGAPRS